MGKEIRIREERIEVELGENRAQIFPRSGRIVKTMIAQVSPRKYQSFAATDSGSWLDEHTTLEAAVEAVQHWYDELGK